MKRTFWYYSFNNQYTIISEVFCRSDSIPLDLIRVDESTSACDKLRRILYQLRKIKDSKSCEKAKTKDMNRPQFMSFNYPSKLQ